jgi:hypothetical protein
MEGVLASVWSAQRSGPGSSSCLKAQIQQFSKHFLLICYNPILRAGSL